MSNFKRKERSFALPEGHVRLVPSEDGFSVLFLPRGAMPHETHMLVGAVVKRSPRWGWTAWHGQTRLHDLNRLEEAAGVVARAASESMKAIIDRAQQEGRG